MPTDERVRTTLEVRADARQVGQLEGLFKRVFSPAHVARFNDQMSGIADALGEIVKQQQALVMETRGLRSVAEGYAAIKREAEAAGRAARGVAGAHGGGPGGAPRGGGGFAPAGAPGGQRRATVAQSVGGLVRGTGALVAGGLGGVGVLPGMVRAGGGAVSEAANLVPGLGAILKGLGLAATAVMTAGTISSMRNYGKFAGYAPELSRAQALGTRMGPDFMLGAQGMGFGAPEATQMATGAARGGVRGGIRPSAGRAGVGADQVVSVLRMFRERGGAVRGVGGSDMNRLERVVAAGIKLGFNDAQLPQFVSDLTGALESLRDVTGARVDPASLLGTAQFLQSVAPETFSQERGIRAAAGVMRGAQGGAGSEQVRLMALRAAGFGSGKSFLEAQEALETGDLPTNFFQRFVGNLNAYSRGGSDEWRRAVLRRGVREIGGGGLGRDEAQALLGETGDGAAYALPQGVGRVGAMAGRAMGGPAGEVLRTQAEITNRELNIGMQSVEAMSTLRRAVVSLEEALDPKIIAMLQKLIDTIQTIPAVKAAAGRGRKYDPSMDFGLPAGGHGEIIDPPADPSAPTFPNLPTINAPASKPQSALPDAGEQRLARSMASALRSVTLTVNVERGQAIFDVPDTAGIG